jgi:hypothetical protein
MYTEVRGRVLGTRHLVSTGKLLFGGHLVALGLRNHTGIHALVYILWLTV